MRKEYKPSSAKSANNTAAVYAYEKGSLLFSPRRFPAVRLSSGKLEGQARAECHPKIPLPSSKIS
ncbi:MAG TPA: hypothetical protein VIT23_05710, partial [Terrimicrobiaceae bacterium]